MSLDHYIFSVLSAKKSWFHCFIFGADNDTSAPSILFKLASPYLLHALAMAWEFTNVTLRFLPSILHPLLKSPEALILLAFCELFIKLLSKICAKILIKIQQELIFVHFIQTIQHLSSVFLTFIIKNTTIIFWLNSKRSLNQPIYSNNISYFYLT